jgi:hypothetical protein
VYGFTNGTLEVELGVGLDISPHRGNLRGFAQKSEFAGKCGETSFLGVNFHNFHRVLNFHIFKGVNFHKVLNFHIFMEVKL